MCPCTCNTKMKRREKCRDAPLKAVGIPIQCKVTQLLKKYHSPNFAFLYEHTNLQLKKSTKRGSGERVRTTHFLRL